MLGQHVWPVGCVCVQAVLVDHAASVTETKRLTDLVESKAQKCEAAVTGQREALEKARNSALAHDQAVMQLNVRPLPHVCSHSPLLCFS